jgi:hypothetical protein
MAKTITAKPSKGHPRVLKTVQFYADQGFIDDVDAWRRRQEGECSRSDAIKRMCRRVMRAEAASLMEK